MFDFNKYISYNKKNILPTIETILKSRNIVELPINPELNIDSNIESNLYKTEDNYGVTYYYKGNVNNNYVLLADKLWRIVRINGNDTVRLILDDTIGLSKFNSATNIIVFKYSRLIVIILSSAIGFSVA